MFSCFSLEPLLVFLMSFEVSDIFITVEIVRKLSTIQKMEKLLQPKNLHAGS